MRAVAIWIPGAPCSPNRRPSSTRLRMALVKEEREKATLCARAVRNRERIEPFSGPTHVHYELRRSRLLDLSNAWASIKHMEDGIVSVLLPHGDGPRTPYRFTLAQVQVPVGADGLLVTLTEEVKKTLDKEAIMD